MPQLHFEITVNRPVSEVFALIADFNGYGRWLNPSRMFDHLMEISENPVTLGTTYIDHGKNSTMYGQVTVYEPPLRIGFEQKTSVKVGVTLGTLTVTINYTLRGGGNSTYVQRDVTVETQSLLKLAESMLVNQISAENARILQAMKTALEKPG